MKVYGFFVTLKKNFSKSKIEIGRGGIPDPAPLIPLDASGGAATIENKEVWMVIRVLL